MRRLGVALGASVVLVGLAVGAHGLQDERKPAAAAPAGGPQDRAELPTSLDSWYKVTAGDAPIGFVHVLLQRATGGARFDYNVLLEIEREVPDPKEPEKRVTLTETLSIIAKLDDTYSPISLREVYNIGGVDILTNLTDSGAGRRLEVVLPNATRRSVPVPSDEDFYFYTDLMLLAMRQNEQFSRPGLRKAKVFMAREDGTAGVAEVSFEVAQLAKREYLGKQIPCTKITFVKAPPALRRDQELMEAHVDKFGRILEASVRGGIKMVLVKDEEEAVGKESRLRHQGRRDPFRKDLALVKEGEGKREEISRGPEVPATTADKLQDRIAEVNNYIGDLRRAHESGQLEDAEKIYQKILAFYIKMREVALRERPDLLAKVDELKKETEKIHGGAKNVLAQARRFYVAALADFEQENCAEMEKKLAEIRKLQERPELVNTEELLEVSGWVGDLDPKLARCKTRLELARKKLVLSGTLSHYDEKPQLLDLSINLLGHSVGAPHPVRFIQATQFAVINDKMYKVGDIVEGEGVRVEKIWTHGVLVSLKEETREVGIRQ